MANLGSFLQVQGHLSRVHQQQAAMEFGVYIPIYGDWLRGAPVEESKVGCACALEAGR